MATIDINSEPVAYLAERDWRLRHLVEKVGSIEIGPKTSGFQNLARSIVEQMLSTKVADTINGRVCELCGGEISQQAVQGLSVEQLRGTGMSGRKAEYLLNLAAEVSDDDIAALDQMSDHDAMESLLAIKGVGEWTAQMFLLFHLERTDIIPVGDLTFRKSFLWLYGAPVDDHNVREAICNLWHPYSSYAARYLYRALDTGLVSSGPAREVLGF